MWLTVGEVGTQIVCHGRSQYECGLLQHRAANSFNATDKSRRAADLTIRVHGCGSFCRWRAYAWACLTVRTDAATSLSGIPYIRASHEKLTTDASSSSSDMRCSGRPSAALTRRRERELLSTARCIRHPLISERHQTASVMVGRVRDRLQELNHIACLREAGPHAVEFGR